MLIDSEELKEVVKDILKGIEVNVPKTDIDEYYKQLGWRRLSKCIINNVLGEIKKLEKHKLPDDVMHALNNQPGDNDPFNKALENVREKDSNNPNDPTYQCVKGQ